MIALYQFGVVAGQVIADDDLIDRRLECQGRCCRIVESVLLCVALCSLILRAEVVF